MENKTEVHAVDGKQELRITRVFDLSIDLLFKAYADPEIVSQWMGTNVIKLENRPHGGWQFETRDAQGNVVFRANGVYHEWSLNHKITRTFEMENATCGVQLEFLEFEPLTDESSKLHMHIIYKTVGDRDQMLQFGMSKGMHMAHNRLQKVAEKLK